MKNEQLSEIHRKNMEAAMRLAQLSIENSQKVMALQSQLARDLFAGQRQPGQGPGRASGSVE